MQLSQLLWAAGLTALGVSGEYQFLKIIKEAFVETH
jgi:hypothetical protein